MQRVWIALELKQPQLRYQYIEVDPYRKPPDLLAVNPRGLVPALRHGPAWACHESSVLMEYVRRRARRIRLADARAVLGRLARGPR